MNNLTKKLSTLHWRYATKKFDNQKKLSPEELDLILESGRLAPSSFGLQFWKFLVIENKDLREKIQTAAWNQTQVTDASHLIVLATPNEYHSNRVDEYVTEIAQTRGKTVESLKGYADMMKGTASQMGKEGFINWVDKQVYIALGFMMYTAAEHQIDSCPLEGFDQKQVDQILGLEKQGLHSVVLLPIGHRSKDDQYAEQKKVRYPAEKVIQII